MAKMPTPGSTAPPWVPTWHLDVRLHHGCLRHQASAILRTAIDPTLGRPDVDFGRGFYTTTLRRQAADWAYLQHIAIPASSRRSTANDPVVIWFQTPRTRLAQLESLCFARGDYQADEYWSLVQHCRSSVRATGSSPAVVRHHERGGSGVETWYDLVCGPVAAFWAQKSAMVDSDQYSFHTAKGANVLNDILRAGTRSTDYDVENA